MPTAEPRLNLTLTDDLYARVDAIRHPLETRAAAIRRVLDGALPREPQARPVTGAASRGVVETGSIAARGTFDE